MKSIYLNSTSKKILMDGLLQRKKILLKELSEIESTLSELSTDNSIIEKENSWIDRIVFIFSYQLSIYKKETPLTVRAMLELMYHNYKDLDRKNDRANIQSLTTILNQQIKRYGEKSVIRKVSTERPGKYLLRERPEDFSDLL